MSRPGVEALAGFAYALASSKPKRGGTPAEFGAALCAWKRTVLRSADLFKLEGATRAWFLRAARW